MIQQAISSVLENKSLLPSEVRIVANEIISGSATPSQVGAFLAALRMRGETVSEIVSFATTLREMSVQIAPKISGRLIDTCGTGGDRMNTFNVSTVAALVAAGAGATIAKHGNRSVTSNCGSADLLERVGFNLTVEPKKVERSIEEIGIGFMFAPVYHPALKQVGPIRKELGIRTIFNMLGPLMNPANANAQLLGVYSIALTPQIANVLRELGREEALVVHGIEGLDEISLERTRISWLRDGKVSTKEYSSKDFGVERASVDSLAVESAEQSVAEAVGLLSGSLRHGPKRDFVLANAGAALVLAGRAEGFREGAALAQESIEGGAAHKKLTLLVKYSGGDLSKLEEFESRAS